MYLPEAETCDEFEQDLLGKRDAQHNTITPKTSLVKLAKTRIRIRVGESSQKLRAHVGKSLDYSFVRVVTDKEAYPHPSHRNNVKNDLSALGRLDPIMESHERTGPNQKESPKDLQGNGPGTKKNNLNKNSFKKLTKITSLMRLQKLSKKKSSANTEQNSGLEHRPRDFQSSNQQPFSARKLHLRSDFPSKSFKKSSRTFMAGTNKQTINNKEFQQRKCMDSTKARYTEIRTQVNARHEKSLAKSLLHVQPTTALVQSENPVDLLHSDTRDEVDLSSEAERVQEFMNGHDSVYIEEEEDAISTDTASEKWQENPVQASMETSSKNEKKSNMAYKKWLPKLKRKEGAKKSHPKTNPARSKDKRSEIDDNKEAGVISINDKQASTIFLDLAKSEQNLKALKPRKKPNSLLALVKPNRGKEKLRELKLEKNAIVEDNSSYQESTLQDESDFDSYYYSDDEISSKLVQTGTENDGVLQDVYDALGLVATDFWTGLGGACFRAECSIPFTTSTSISKEPSSNDIGAELMNSMDKVVSGLDHLIEAQALAPPTVRSKKTSAEESTKPSKKMSKSSSSSGAAPASSRKPVLTTKNEKRQ